MLAKYPVGQVATHVAATVSSKGNALLVKHEVQLAGYEAETQSLQGLLHFNVGTHRLLAVSIEY